MQRGIRMKCPSAGIKVGFVYFDDAIKWGGAETRTGKILKSYHRETFHDAETEQHFSKDRVSLVRSCSIVICECHHRIN